MKTQEENFAGVKLPGIMMLILNILFLIGIIVTFVWCVSNVEGNESFFVPILIVDLVLFLINCLFWGGFTQIEPNEAMVLIFFGRYDGTIKENGFYWVNPFFTKKKLCNFDLC